MSQTTSYNLLDEGWIPVLYRNGRVDRAGIIKALEDAHLIRQFAASNPMDRVSLLRFLLAVLMWSKENVKLAIRGLIERNTGIPREWLSKLKENRDAFNLLGDGKRFYQDASIRGNNSRPVADLLVEFPGADSVNHMRHVVHDGSYGFCPACCALGILRFSIWAPANRFYPASVNPGSAAYAFAEGMNLLQTFCTNLPETNPPSAQASWLNDSPPNSPDTVTKFAWRPRRLWLNVASEEGVCANCGISGVLITSLVNAGGWPTPTAEGKTKKFWDNDPHLLKEDEPISLPEIGSNISLLSTKFWRTALRLLQEKVEKVTIVGPVVNKFIFQDATSIILPVASENVKKRADFSSACNGELQSLLKAVTPNQKRDHPEIGAAIKLLTPNAEAQVRERLNRVNATTDNNVTQDKAFLQEVYIPMLKQVIASVVPGSTLRRLSAQNHAHSLLNKKISELVEKDAQIAPVKTKRSHKKGDSQ